ncbi:MAG TPA: 2-oxo acid dehydrogenase subunit E2, partial [Kofleriaceae bacterium]|nr:2-oxo acid dehydrogenase subunit E2 [Kofleriaceae bacterium]
MAQILGLPKLSPTMEEGVLVRWTKKEGDKVSPGDLIAEVETDKANMDFNIEDEGVLLKFLVKEGETVKLGAPVAIIGKAGEDVAALVEQAKAGGSGGAAAPAPAKPADGKPAKGAEDSASALAARREPREATRPEQDQTGKAAVKPAAAKPAAAAVKPAPAKPTAGAKAAPTASAAAPGRLLASPLAKTLAIELGIDLRQVTGTGPGGRIVERDVRAAAENAGKSNGHGSDDDRAEAAAHDGDAGDGDAGEGDAGDGDSAEPAEDDRAGEARAAAPPRAAATSQALTVRARPVAQDADSDGDWTDAPASSMRKRIASRMTEAKRDVPHIYLMRELDAAPLLAYRQRLNDLLGDKPGGLKISVNDLVIKATALALRRMPECNASWQGDAIRQFHRVHIGVAVAIPEGLVTPVVRDADAKGIGSIAAEIKDLADRARKRALKVHEINGSTFSVSNLGMFGIERFTAIINPPEAGILAV